MVIDGHLHIRGEGDRPPEMLEKMAEAGVDGALVISEPPVGFRAEKQDPDSFDRRMDRLMSWCDGHDTLFPLFWLDPLEDGVIDQAHRAIERGAEAFKVICNRYYPSDERAMTLFREIAGLGKSILFHSGILWDGKPSGKYCRPVEFEALLDIPGLAFTLAHISWPWCDESIAVYGKFLNAETKDGAHRIEMYIDTTPGTPEIYRRDALMKLFTIGYDVQHNVVFGTDCMTNDYNVDWARDWIRRDQEIMKELGVGHMIEDVFGNNALRFLGRMARPAERSLPRQGE